MFVIGGIVHRSGNCFAPACGFVTRVPCFAKIHIAFDKRGVVRWRKVADRDAAVIVYFVETETAEQEYFTEHLPAHEVRFVSQLEKVGDDAEVLSTFIYSAITEEFLAAHPRLRLIATRSTASDHLPLEACRRAGVAIARVPAYGETTVAEHTFALILALSRRLREVMLAPKGGRFSYEATRGFDLAGKTLGIIGMGSIGQHVAQLAHAFRMKVLACDIACPPELAQSLDFNFVPLNDLLAQSHIISLHTPLTTVTYHLLDRETFARCRRGVIIINTARGALIDTQALREALESGQVGGAGLDVLQDERVMRQAATNIIAANIVEHLRSDAQAHDARDADHVRELQELMLGDAVLARKDVVFTPHVAFNSVEAVARLNEVSVENIEAFASGQPVNLVS